MKIVLLLSNELKHNFLIRELSRRHLIAGVVIEDKYTAQERIKTILRNSKGNIFGLFRVIYYKLKMRKLDLRDKRIIEKYFLEDGKPLKIDDSIPIVKVRNINQAEAVSFIKTLAADLAIVFGTSLVKEEITAIPKKGVINAHTGLSPYYRGGQSAFWALFNDEPQYIGVTVHWLSQGIDSGDIILQGRPEIDRDDNLCSIECKLAILAVELLKRSIEKIERGTANRIMQSVKGRIYLSKQFTLDKRLVLEKRLRQGLIDRYLERKSRVYDEVKIIDD